jgi:hypothetical protein
MLGMNDVGRPDYGPQKIGPEFEEKRRRSFDIYDENMHKLMDALQKSGARLILIRPSIYDETTALPSVVPNPTTGVNGALGKCSEKIDKWATDSHSGTADFYGTMNTVNDREQKKDPAFTIVGPDRVHPGPVGHFVMAYAFLKAQGLPAEVATINVNAGGAKAAEGSNSQVRNIKKLPAGVEFDALERALPLVVPDAAKPALQLVPFTKELNQELLIVTKLSKGRYGVKIDDKDVGEYSSDELKAGVNLAENDKTPQYEQSAEATKISAERTKAGASLRDIVAQKYGMSKAKVDVGDDQDVGRRIREQMKQAKDEGKPVNKAWELLLQDLAEPGKLEQRYDDLSAALLKACQPKEHHYSIVKK